MAIQHPSRHYIHYLLSKQYVGGKVLNATKGVLQSAGAREVVLRLSDLNLPCPQNALALNDFLDNVNRMKPLLLPPPGFNPKSKAQTEATKRYLKIWKIGDAWAGLPEFDRALYIVEHEAALRRALCVMLHGPLSRQTIAKYLRSHFQLSEQDMNVKIVMLLEHYFWNTDILDVSGWRAVLKNSGISDAVDYLSAIKAPRDSAGATMVLELGLRAKLSNDAVTPLEAMQHMSFGMFLESMVDDKASLLSRSQSALQAFSVFRDTGDQLDRLRGGSTEILETLREIRVKHDKGELRHQLPGSAPPTIDVAGEEVANDREP